MTEQLEIAKRKRATIRTITTKLLQKIEAELRETNLDVRALDISLEQLAAKEVILGGLDREVESATTDLNALEADLIVSEEYREKIIYWKKTISLAIKDQGTRGGATAADRPPSTQAVTVKLPRLTIEKYDGNACGWQSFWSQYEAAVDRNSGLAKVEKFTYLKSYLEGAAASAISGLALADENYEMAVEILMERFGRKDIVISAHMNKLLSLQPVRHSSNVTGLRQFYDSCALQIRSLQSLGVESENYGTLLCPIIMKMIPEDITIEYSRRRPSDSSWDAINLLEFIRTEVESRERAYAFTRSIGVDERARFVGSGERQERKTNKK